MFRFGLRDDIVKNYGSPSMGFKKFSPHSIMVLLNFHHKGNVILYIIDIE